MKLRITRSGRGGRRVGRGFTGEPFLVAYAGLLEPGLLRPADTILVTAASSSVGLAAIATANRIGAVPIATSRGRGKAQQLLDAGAAHVVVTGEQDLAEAALELTDGRGLDVAFDAVAGPGVEDIARAMAPNGTIVIHGRLSGSPGSARASPGGRRATR